MSASPPIADIDQRQLLQGERRYKRHEIAALRCERNAREITTSHATISGLGLFTQLGSYCSTNTCGRVVLIKLHVAVDGVWIVPGAPASIQGKSAPWKPDRHASLTQIHPFLLTRIANGQILPAMQLPLPICKLRRPSLYRRHQTKFFY